MKERNYQNYKRLTKEQMPRVRKLVRQCCNYDHGACIALDDGAGCVCVQSIPRIPPPAAIYLLSRRRDRRGSDPGAAASI